MFLCKIIIFPFEIAVLPFKCSDLEGDFPSIKEMHSVLTRYVKATFLLCIHFAIILLFAYIWLFDTSKVRNEQEQREHI